MPVICLRAPLGSTIVNLTIMSLTDAAAAGVERVRVRTLREARRIAVLHMMMLL